MSSVLHIIKIGGNVIDSPNNLDDFLEKFSALQGKKILVHGGGKIATRIASRLGIEAQMVEGRRVTDEKMLEVVTMVYAGLTNKTVVAKLQMFGCDAIGLSGADANTIKAIRRPAREVDYGFVGDILADSVNVLSIKRILESGLTPVFSAITHNGLGQLLNTNADTIASSLAIALSKTFETRLIYCFEKNGVLRDVEDDNSVIRSIKLGEFEDLKGAGVIYEGMIPKLENAFYAIGKGVKNVYIGKAVNLHKYQQGEFGTCLLST
ncbi:MAG: acetylglutamate kinase [Sphingobacterium sp.]|uniref:acetylglutamate kinase n=1 Tax=Sphingobacterium sp. JB170 TaxID=1434842 RepID=UPI00097EF07C|nr:acetylglutamate kinase [Sphingobacterium sp. JB170]SJN50323.1 Acetylglutamate kinase [Sphingobacterium sp. JB170]